MNAASQVPSGVLISTLVSETCCCAPRSAPAAAIMPAATVVTKSRRVSSSLSMVVVLQRGRMISERDDLCRSVKRSDPIAESGCLETDRWLGGVHLQGNASIWRWDDARQHITLA